MSLLFPLGLLALAAWLVPLLIHLARRHQYAPLDFAALRWLRARIRPRQNVRFDEWLLLLVRLLLLASLALLLARPVLHGGAADTHAVTVVAPGLDGAALRGQIAEGDWRWLAPGFPALADGAPAPHQPLASLLRELDQRLPAGAPLTVYVPDPMPGLDGERPRLSRAVNWRPILMAPTSARTAALPVLQVGGEIAEGEQRVLAAFQRAWSNQGLSPARGAGTAPDAGQIGVWLAAAPLPAAWQAWVRQGGSALVASGSTGEGWTPALRDADGALVLEQRLEGSGRLLRFTSPLTPTALPVLRDPGFPRQLLAVVAAPAPPTLAAAATQQPVRGGATPRPLPRELTPWLLALIVLLFALERVVATSPRRGAGA
ncbi:BatA domain-containing protein [Stenotrophomonas rhizophila]